VLKVSCPSHLWRKESGCKTNDTSLMRAGVNQVGVNQVIAERGIREKMKRDWQ